ncbi:excinuclease ABC subunit UvrC [Thiospirillum jenense]|uniref:UvrABC system protein C n=1 Tax=Thiospirillum jenense TaxID=1653858 RepID=A0A839HQM9_9GAMM|nr:excinuclease ABC subunit UvrC [Thiospirillum jenense]MBB1127342.1 excinuclease ABC subunit UvrC [Thiospirillum jenense]
MPSDAIATVLVQLPEQPGVYRFLAADNQLLYIGKAKNLKRRVSSYFTRSLNHRLQTMIARVVDIHITVTRTEGEALLLENDLIKTHQPRFNVLLRDDKSYPFIYLSSQDQFPRLAFYRGARNAKGEYFGPYPSSQAVRDTLRLLQLLFPVRHCHDAMFRHRSRPCLQYQIHRCRAPCVGFISAEEYAQDVLHTRQFLTGHAQTIIQLFTDNMERAAAALKYEQAALWRDRIALLTKMQQRQFVTQGRGGDDFDLLACVQAGGHSCVEVVMMRGGRQLGNAAHFPQVPPDTPPAAVLSAFMAQFYANRPAPFGLPPLLLVNIAPTERAFLQAALSQRASRAVKIHHPQRGAAVQWLRLAIDNANLALNQHLATRADYQQRLTALRDLLGLATVPTRLECFDISHTAGELTVAACVVFDTAGPRPSAYRRFNLDNLDQADFTPGDDYAALAQAVTRHYRRALQPVNAAPLPDVLLVDGGRGQLRTVAEAVTALGVTLPCIVAVAKGAARKVGEETLWRWGDAQPLATLPNSPALHLIQHLRDEAHRFAITGHRARRSKARQASALDNIPGIGAKRRRQLLTAFGGLRGLHSASVADLARVAGIGSRLAQQLYYALHPTDS